MNKYLSVKRIFISVLFILYVLIFLNKSVYASGNESIKTSQYTITPAEGQFEKAFNIQIGAKKGYRVYYTFSNKFSIKKFTKPGKTKAIKVNKNVTLKVIAVKKSLRLSNKKLNSKSYSKKVKKYVYSLKGISSDDNDIPSIIKSLSDNCPLFNNFK